MNNLNWRGLAVRYRSGMDYVWFSFYRCYVNTDCYIWWVANEKIGYPEGAD